MIKLIGALLDVSRVELGSFDVTPASVKVHTLVRNVLDELQLQIREKKLNVLEHEENQDLALSTDANLLRMVLQNILTNAVKYTPEGGRISVSVSLKHKGETFDGRRFVDDSVVFTIEDTGYGIPKREQGKIFSKLFRANNIKKKFPDGTGLGLYIVKTALTKLGGDVWFSSEENKGTTFHVALPL